MNSHRSQYLDASDEEESASEAIDLGEDSRLQRLPQAPRKRRKLSHSPSEGSLQASADERDGVDQPNAALEDSHNGKAEEDSLPNLEPGGSSKPMSAKKKALSKAKLEAAEQKARKTGVIYLSRVPPFMKPSTLRGLLEPYGTILRIFLTPEPQPAYLKRRRTGGNSKRAFVDGWIEFVSKRRAKACVETLNGNTIGGKKAGYYHDDLWNLKYLKGFKWDDLMEQVQGEKRAREGKMRAEIQRETRERKAFLGNLETAKRDRGMEARRSMNEANARDPEAVDEEPETRPSSTSGEGEVQRRKARGEMRFRQNEVRPQTDEFKGKDVGRVLSKIF